MKLSNTWLIGGFGLVACHGADFGCGDLQSNAGDGGDTFYARASRCDDGVDKEVDCTRDEDLWTCVCWTDGVEGGALADGEAFYQQVTDPSEHENTLDLAMLLAADDCGW